MLGVLFEYCNDWGLTVNTSKTAIMVFMQSGRQLEESNTFKLGNTVIPLVREFCYLKVIFSLNGSLKMAQKKLRQKGLRGYLSLKKCLEIRGLRKTALFRLFDALISPVASYSCQVRLSATHAFHQIIESLNGNNTDALTLHLPKMKIYPLERLHLSFLKWTLGVNKYTANAAVWGDTGHYPLVITHAKQVFAYRERLEKLDKENSQALVKNEKTRH